MVVANHDTKAVRCGVRMMVIMVMIYGCQTKGEGGDSSHMVQESGGSRVYGSTGNSNSKTRFCGDETGGVWGRCAWGPRRLELVRSVWVLECVGKDGRNSTEHARLQLVKDGIRTIRWDEMRTRALENKALGEVGAWA